MNGTVASRYGTHFGALVFLLSVFLPVAAMPQAADTWSQAIGGPSSEVLEAVVRTTDGNSVIASWTSSFGSGQDDAWLVKFDPWGAVLWQYTYGGPDDERPWAMAETSDGGVIFVGRTHTFGVGNGDAWACKLDSTGDILWQKSYGAANSDWAEAVHRTSGGFIVGGGTYSYGAGGADAWVILLDHFGNLLQQFIIGGDGYDSVVDVVPTDDGGFAALINGNPFSEDNWDLWLIKMDSDLNILWQKTYGGPEDEEPYGLAALDDGGFYLAGQTDSFGEGDSDYWVLRVDSGGDVIWERAIGGAEWDDLNALVDTTGGGAFVAGESGSFGSGSSDAWGVLFDPLGDVVWQRQYGGDKSDEADAVANTGDWGLFIAGRTGSFNLESQDCWLVRIPESGALNDSCGFGQETDGVVTVTSATVRNPSPAVMVPTMTTMDTSATRLVSTGVSTLICEGPAPCTLECKASVVPAESANPYTFTFELTAYTWDCIENPLFFWEFGDGDTSTNPVADHEYPAGGSYTWTLTVTVEDQTCIRQGTAEVPCSLTCTASAIPTSGTAPLDVNFTAVATPSNCSGQVTYAWDFGDTNTSNVQNPSHQYAAAGTYTWTMTATVDGVQCQQQGQVVVGEPCTLTCTASANPASGTVPLDVTFTAAATPSNCSGQVTYAWDFGDTNTSNVQNPGHQYAAAGTYTWSMTATVDGIQCQQQGQVIVDEPCTLTCTASANPASGTAPLDVTFTAAATPSNCSGQVTYAWDFGDTNTSNVQNPTHQYAAAGTYTWSVTATVDGVSCTQTGSITVEDPIPGDCDGNGTVTIGEVQKVIRMHLRLDPPGCGADCNGDGQISIGELQKAINNHLRIPTLC